MNTFNYGDFDEISKNDFDGVEKSIMEIERFIFTITSPRPKAIALAKLEELLMWITNCIGEDQHERVINSLSENKANPEQA